MANILTEVLELGICHEVPLPSADPARKDRIVCVRHKSTSGVFSAEPS